MALAAICPHCQTMFRVASDQLKLRGGIVRCGACHEVFDGNAALVDLDAIPVQDAAPALDEGALGAADVHTPSAPVDEDGALDTADTGDGGEDADAAIGALPVLNSVVRDSREDSVPAPPALDGNVDPAPEPLVTDSDAAADVENAPAADDATYTLDFDTTLPDGEVEEHLVALPPPDDDDDSDRPVEARPDQAPEHASEPPPARPLPAAAADSLAPLLKRASAAAEDRPGPATVLPAGQQAQARARRAKAAAERKQAAPPVVAAPPEAAPDDEPEFVRRSRQREATGERTRMLLIAGAIVLALALLVQGVWTFKNTLAARFPGARPVLGGLCAVMGCKVELPTQIDALAVETGELQTLDANASTFVLSTLLRNQSDLVQAWPHLELALTDANDKTLVRRVFTPADYLPPGALAARGFAARSEQSVKLTFQLDQIKASGYHLAIFYP